MPFDIECGPKLRARDPRRAPAFTSLDGLIAVLERVAASRAAEAERERDEPNPRGEPLAATT